MATIKKTCRLVKISGWSFLSSLILIAICTFLLEVYNIEDQILIIPVIVAGFLFTASPIISIAALIKIYKSREQERSKGTAIAIIVVVCFVLLMLSPMYAVSRLKASKQMCGNHLSSLGKAILLYANEHNYSLPDPNKWCDLLIEDADALPKIFICPDSDDVEGESSYALNRNACGKKLDELPPDLVLLFDTNSGKTEGTRNFSIQNRDFFSHLDGKNQKRLKSKSVYEGRFNQVGGPQILSVDNHQIGRYILFANCHVEYVDANQISELRWTIEGKETFPEFKPKLPQEKSPPIGYHTLSVILILLILGLVVKLCITKYHLFAITLGIITTGLTMMFFGFFIGAFTTQFFHSYKSSNIELITGAIAGFITGIGLGAIASVTPEDKRKEKSFTGYSVSVGMAAGVICWLIVQITTTVAKQAFEPISFFWTLPLGIIAGAITGLLTGLVLRLSQNKKNES